MPQLRFSVDLSTNYMGFCLPSPLMPGASPLADDLDVVRRLEDAGAAAIVLRSRFEEHIVSDRRTPPSADGDYRDTQLEAVSYFVAGEADAPDSEEYLDQVRRTKQAVAVPVFASINGTTPGAWTGYATLIEQAGADALELNYYRPTTDLFESSATAEARLLEVARLVKRAVRIPVAVKLLPYFASVPNLVRELAGLGINGVVLFNRFYQPDIDLDTPDTNAGPQLSSSSELVPRLRAIAAVAGRVSISLAASGGVHTSQDAIKAVLAGAEAVQVVSALLQRGPQYLRTLGDGMAQWLEEHGIESLEHLKGNMSRARLPEGEAFERGTYMRALRTLCSRTQKAKTFSN